MPKNKALETAQKILDRMPGWQRAYADDAIERQLKGGGDMPQHPIQPLVIVGNVLRFKENKLVTYLLENGGIDMNHLAHLNFPKEDFEQFAQLIGYSWSGASTLSYMSEEVLQTAKIRYENPGADIRNIDWLRHRVEELETVLSRIQELIS